MRWLNDDGGNRQVMSFCFGVARPQHETAKMEPDVAGSKEVSSALGSRKMQLHDNFMICTWGGCQA